MKLGACVRRLGFSVWDRLHGAPVHHHLEELEQAQTVSPEELELWQRERLYALLCHARDTTDFYRQLIPQDLSPEESFNVVHALPLMTKAQIKADPEAFMAGAFPPHEAPSGHHQRVHWDAIRVLDGPQPESSRARGDLVLWTLGGI
ncbi:hypothetical protein KAU37_02960 [Candidatus Bipolaricaulota bacterium]|nr:hypothetical protein [Candidatus Bipolaricaulota bacterium]